MSMLAISHSYSKLLVLEIEKSLLGKLNVKSGGKENLKNDSPWQDSIVKIARNKHAAFGISDTNTCIFRFEVSKDIKHDALDYTIIQKVKETTHMSIDHFAYDYFLLKTDENSQHMLFVALPLEKLSLYHELSKKADMKSLTVIPASLAIFEILKHSIEKDEIILYVDSSQHTSNLTFFDSHCPVMNAPEPIEHTVCIDEIKKALAAFQEKYNKHVTTIVLGGEKIEAVDRDTIAKATGIETIRSDTIFHDALLDLGITFNDENPHTYLNALGLGILSFQKDSLNLAKKENLSRLNRHSYQSQNEAEHHFFKKNVIMLSALLIFIPLVLFGYSELKQSKKTEERTPIRKIDPTPPPAPVLERNDLTLLIQNGSGETGLAGKVSSNLKKKGYTQIDTENADSFSYKAVTVKVKESKKQYKDLLVFDLKDDYTINAEIETLDTDSTYDAIIIIGK